MERNAKIVSCALRLRLPAAPTLCHTWRRSQGVGHDTLARSVLHLSMPLRSNPARSGASLNVPGALGPRYTQGVSAAWRRTAVWLYYDAEWRAAVILHCSTAAGL
jgi:hypothetical protein